MKPAPRPRTPASTPTAEPVQTGRPRIPLSVIAIALVVGGLVVALTSVLLPNRQVGTGAPPATVAADSVARPDTGLDVRWRSGRQDARDCIGTFEVVRGGGTRAQFAASVMDSGGRVIARDSARVNSVVRGLLVQFRFRRIACGAIDDWQLQVTTPKAPTG